MSEILLKHQLDRLEGLVSARHKEIRNLLSIGLAANQKGRAEVTNERLEVAIDLLDKLLSEVKELNK